MFHLAFLALLVSTAHTFALALSPRLQDIQNSLSESAPGCNPHSMQAGVVIIRKIVQGEIDPLIHHSPYTAAQPRMLWTRMATVPAQSDNSRVIKAVQHTVKSDLL